jgi:HK97 family phage portal protein
MMLKRLLGSDESRAVTAASLFASGVDFPRRTRAGVNITEDNSMRIAALYAAVRLISDSVSMLPMDTYVRVNGERRPYRPKPGWVEVPDVDGRPRQAFLQQWLISKLVSHAACVRIVRSEDGEPVGFSVLNPQRVQPRRNGAGQVFYVVDDGAYTVAASDMIYDAEVIKPGEVKGTSRVDEMRETLGLTQALTEWSASFFGNGSHAAGIIEVPGEMTREQAKGVQDAWEEGHKGLRKAHRPGILAGGAKWQQTSVDPDKAQAIQAREFALEEVARIFRIPPAMLQSTKPGTMAYASREQDAQQFVTFTLLPYITALESHLSRLLPGDVFVKFNVDGLLRASLTERYAAYSQGVQAGFLSINDIHRLEDMRPVDGGDVLRVPLSHVDLNAANVTEMDMRVTMATQLINVGFDPEATLGALRLPTIGHTGLPSVQLQNAAQQAEAGAEDYTDGGTASGGSQGKSGSSSVRQLSIAEVIQKVYLGVGKVITTDEAREIVNSAGGNLSVPGPEFDIAQRSLESAMPAPVVNVSLPESPARSKRVERDDDGNITAIIEEQ